MLGLGLGLGLALSGLDYITAGNLGDFAEPDNAETSMVQPSRLATR